MSLSSFYTKQPRKYTGSNQEILKEKNEKEKEKEKIFLNENRCTTLEKERIMCSCSPKITLTARLKIFIIKPPIIKTNRNSY